MAYKITYNNFEITLLVFMPSISTNHAITYTNVHNEIFKYSSQNFSLAIDGNSMKG